jgi:hypothetical protein
VIHVTGGGIACVTDLLTVPGASRTVLDVRIPYSMAALDDTIAGRSGSARSGSATSASTALELATAAFEAASTLTDSVQIFGVGATAALTTDRERRGEDRAHIAVVSVAEVTEAVVTSEELSGLTTRIGQDRLVADRILLMIAAASGVV